MLALRPSFPLSVLHHFPLEIPPVRPRFSRSYRVLFSRRYWHPFSTPIHPPVFPISSACNSFLFFVLGFPFPRGHSTTSRRSSAFRGTMHISPIFMEFLLAPFLPSFALPHAPGVFLYFDLERRLFLPFSVFRRQHSRAFSHSLPS